MMNNPLIRRIGATAVAILLLIYVGYQVYRSQYTGLRTEPAMFSTLSDSISTTGYVLRNEQVIRSNLKGVLNYTVDDGEKVAKNGTVAEMFATEEGAAAKNRIARIDEELSQLEQLSSPGDFSASNPQLLGTQISKNIVGLLDDLRGGLFSSLTDDKTNLQLLLSQKQIIIGAESGGDFGEYVASLEAERDSLESLNTVRTGVIRSPAGGYFIHSVDGLESSLDEEEILSLSVSDVESLLAREPAPVSENVIGKVSRDFNWYIACVLTEDDLVRLGQIRDVTVEMPFASATQIPATIIQINEDAATGSASAILSCSYMGADLASARKEPLQINLSSYSGVLVNERAIHFADYTAHETDESGNEIETVYHNVQGVYVRSGSRIRFVQVFTDATINGYAVCKVSLSEDERAELVTSRTIQLYDEVVVEGTDLHDGKML